MPTRRQVLGGLVASFIALLYGFVMDKTVGYEGETENTTVRQDLDEEVTVHDSLNSTVVNYENQ